MTNFFGFNYTFPMNMNNWFMPNWSFNDYFGMFQMPSFNVFDSWINSFEFSYNPFALNMPMPSMFPMDYNIFNTPSFNSEKTKNSSGKAVTQSSQNVDTFTRTSGIDYSKDNLSLEGYNSLKGERLASVALNRSVGWTGYCAAYVKSDIQAAGLGPYMYGHAYQMPKILRKNSNFKEISPENVDVSKLPAGCVLVYDKGVEDYSEKYGHTEITTGDGRAVSDGITENLHKKPSTIFIPV